MSKVSKFLGIIIVTSAWHTLTCYGCNDGLWGKSCDKECPTDCVTCTQGSVDGGRPCTSCVPGKFSSPYPYNDNCRNDCRPGCVSCTSADKCNNCVDGSYGTACQYSCYNGCEGGQCDKMDGACTCKTGYASRFCKGQPYCTNNPCACCQNNTCEKNNDNYCTYGCIHGVRGDKCDNECPANCVTCTKGKGDSDRPCTACVPGKYSGSDYDSIYNPYYDDCRHDCRDICVSCISWKKCTECVDGRHGPDCSSVCSTGCEGGTCSKTDGRCSCKTELFKGDSCDQCIAGRFGNDCSKICLFQNCENNECEQIKGICSSCKVGYYGSGQCDKTCPSQCRSSVCDFKNGKCINGCIAGYSGDKCCINNNNCDICSSNTQCLVCKTGYSGDKCCLNNNKCENCSSNTQCSVCKSGYSGDKCCVNNNNCKTCSSYTQCAVCISGYSGDKCCVNNENCLTCVWPSACSKCNSGYDINTNCRECLLNKYGPNCGSDCNSNCLNKGKQSKCYGHNGTCVVGCQEGFYGDKCDLRCHQNCKQFACSRVKGICSHECQDGFIISGSDCVPAVSYDNGDVPVATFGGIFSSIVVAVLIIAGIVVYKRKLLKLLRKIKTQISRLTGTTQSRFHCCSDTKKGKKEFELSLMDHTEDDNGNIDEDKESGDIHVGGSIYYDPKTILGSGSYGVVFKGKSGLYKNKPVAVKKIKYLSNQNAKEVLNINKEIMALETLDTAAENPHIIRFFDSFINHKQKTMYLAFELAIGTLKDYVSPSKASWHISLTVDDVIRGIVSGLNYTHTKGIIHRDLKPVNIFIVEQGISGLKAVIGDFGQAKVMTGNTSTMTGNTGSHGYIAPEIWKAVLGTATVSISTKCNKASDIFSLGLVIYYAKSFGNHPFGINNFAAQESISNGNSPIFQGIANRIDTFPYEDMLKKMLNNNQDDRPSITVVSEHPALMTSDTIITYFGHKSDEFEAMIRAGSSNKNLLDDPNLIPNGNWMNQLPVNMRTFLRSYTLPNRTSPMYSGKETEVRFLLRAIRNTNGHYQGYPPNTQAEMGNYPEGHVTLWLEVCPGLLMHVYNKLGPLKQRSDFFNIETSMS